MFIIERIISGVAPHICMMCHDEGAVVCDWCLPDFAPPLPERCYLCKAATKDSRVCPKCRRKSGLKHVWTRTSYEGHVKDLIHDFKFERKQAAADPIGRMMISRLPFLSADTVVTHVPTATSRVRTRGYDHAELLAREIAGELGLEHKTLLSRATQTRQVGAKRAERIKQIQNAFQVRGRPQDVPVLLVDDLTTTGATLESAAKCLHAAGIKKVSAIVFAQKQ